MKIYTFVFKIIPLMLLLFSFSLFASDNLSDRNLSKKEVREDINQLCHIIKENYVYLDYKESRFNFSWKNKCKQFIKIVDNYELETISATNFGLLMNDLISSLNDDHTYTYSAHVRDRSITGLNLNVRYVAGNYLVYNANQMVLRDIGLSLEQFVSNQYVLKSINDIPIDQVYNLFPFANHSNQYYQKNRFAELIGNQSPDGAHILNYLSEFKKTLPFNTSEKLRVCFYSLLSKKEQCVTYESINSSKPEVKSIGYSPLTSKLKAKRNYYSNIPSEYYGFDFNISPQNIAVLKVPTWGITPEHTSTMQNYLQQVMLKIEEEKIEKLVLDLRFNTGGSPLWKNLLTWLINENLKPKIRGVLKFRGKTLNYFPECISFKNATSEQKITIKKYNTANPLDFMDQFSNDSYGDFLYCFHSTKAESGGFKGKLVLLYDENTFSSNDQFVAATKLISNEKIQTIGVPSNGGSGSGRVIRLNNSNLVVNYSIFSNWGANGKLLENQGSTPNIIINETPASFLNPKVDLYMQEAAKYFGVKEILRGENTVVVSTPVVVNSPISTGKGLKKVTITQLMTKKDSPYANTTLDFDFIIIIKEWIDSLGKEQLAEFINNAGFNFILKSSGAVIKLTQANFAGTTSMGDGSWQGYLVKLNIKQRSVLPQDSSLSIEPQSNDSGYSWSVRRD